MAKIIVKGAEISFFKKEQEDYISLSDMAKQKDTTRTDYIIQNWWKIQFRLPPCASLNCPFAPKYSCPLWPK